MSNKKNGKISGPFDFCNYSMETEHYTQSSDLTQNGCLSPIELFRGFEKIPQIHLQPMDINEFLKTTKITNSKDISVHLKQLNRKCIVKVRREDLHALKQAYKNQNNSSKQNSEPYLKCKICGKDYSSEKKLHNHLENKHTIISIPNKKIQKRVSFSDHVIVHEVKEYHSCRKCTKIFECYKSLKTHMKLKHKKRKCYICNYCSKEFMDRMFFKVHIKLHCSRCGLFFQNRSLHLEHKRNVCRQKKQYTCKTCEEIYFSFMDLKDHSYDHIGTFFICDICKDQFQRKCEVAHHISFSHSKERPTSLHSATHVGDDNIYHCNFCDEETSDKSTMDLHTGVLPDLQNRVMTGYKDNVFCDQCLTKFSTEKEMLQHKWTHFLKKEKKNVQTIFKINEIPQEFFRAKVVVERLKIPQPSQEEIHGASKILSNILSQPQTQIIPKLNSNETPSDLIEKPKINRKILFSKHQCQTCSKYFSSGYCLKRHIATLHNNFENLQCKVCEEVFVWPSLLLNHKCIRLQHPEMPFDDARPEIQIENLYDIPQNGYHDLSNSEEIGSDYMMVSPIVSITESDVTYVPPGSPEKFNHNNAVDVAGNVSPYTAAEVPGNISPYTVVVQEVPIEF